MMKAFQVIIKIFKSLFIKLFGVLLHMYARKTMKKSEEVQHDDESSQLHASDRGSES